MSLKERQSFNVCVIHRFRDSSPTGTVHRHVFWRQFTDTFGDSSPTQFFPKNVFEYGNNVSYID